MPVWRTGIARCMEELSYNTENGCCIGYKKCETICPTDEAKRDDGKAECYLCGRCTDTCPVTGALKYKQRNVDAKNKCRII